MLANTKDIQCEVDNPWLKMGQVVSYHGIRGWVKVRDWSESIGGILNYDSWHIGQLPNDLQPIALTEKRLSSHQVLVRFEACVCREDAQKYLKKYIFIHESCLPALSNDDYYWHQIVNMKVFSMNSSASPILLGRVHSIIETGSHDVLVVRPTLDSLDDKERLIPWVDKNVIDSVDKINRCIQVFWDPDF